MCWLLNNDTKLPLLDQVSNVGIRKRFGAIQTSLSFTPHRSHNIFRLSAATACPPALYDARVISGSRTTSPPPAAAGLQRKVEYRG